jgi:hypothetical protein
MVQGLETIYNRQYNSNNRIQGKILPLVSTVPTLVQLLRTVRTCSSSVTGILDFLHCLLFPTEPAVRANGSVPILGPERGEAPI